MKELNLKPDPLDNLRLTNIVPRYSGPLLKEKMDKRSSSFPFDDDDLGYGELMFMWMAFEVELTNDKTSFTRLLPLELEDIDHLKEDTVYMNFEVIVLNPSPFLKIQLSNVYGDISEGGL